MRRTCTNCKNRHNCSIWRYNTCWRYQPDRTLPLALLGTALFFFALGVLPLIILAAKGFGQ